MSRAPNTARRGRRGVSRSDSGSDRLRWLVVGPCYNEAKAKHVISLLPPTRTTLVEHNHPTTNNNGIGMNRPKLTLPESEVVQSGPTDLRYKNIVPKLSFTLLNISTTNLAACVCAKFDQFLPARFYFVSKRPENFVRTATFPYAAFGPLFAFHFPLFVTKNNNLGWNRHASPHTGTGGTFTGRRYCLRADNRR